jgi:hypothetical protein
MDCPCCPEAHAFAPRPRTPVSLWAPLAIIALVLGAATIASALTTPDARDMKRAASVPTAGRAL